MTRKIRAESYQLPNFSIKEVKLDMPYSILFSDHDNNKYQKTSNSEANRPSLNNI